MQKHINNPTVKKEFVCKLINPKFVIV